MIGSEALLAAVIARLGSADLPDPVRAEGVLDPDAADRERRAREAVAALGADVPDATAETDSGGVQIVTTTVVVLLAAAAPNDRAGADPRTRAPLSALIDRARARLLGWRPDGAASPLTLSRGQLLEVEEARAVWAEEYHVRRVIAGGNVTGAPA